MTLLISIANPRFIILLADRRITRGKTTVDDHYNKLTILCCRDARVAIAFTGLAQEGSFDTSEWIMSYLDKITAPNDCFDTIFEGMRAAIEREFTHRRLVGELLTILVAGFVHANGEATRVSRTISNCDEHGRAVDRFRAVYASAEDGRGTVAIEGVVSSVSKSAVDALGALANSLAGPRHVMRKAVMTLQRAANAKSSMRTIGDYCNSAVIECSPDEPIVATYHVPRADRLVCGPNIIVTGAMCSTGISIQGADALAGPEIGKRALCWCGSGLFFQYCHRKKFGSVYARLRHFKRPLTWVLRVKSPDARPSGSVFCVKGGFE